MRGQGRRGSPRGTRTSKQTRQWGGGRCRKRRAAGGAVRPLGRRDETGRRRRKGERGVGGDGVKEKASEDISNKFFYRCLKPSAKLNVFSALRVLLMVPLELKVPNVLPRPLAAPPLPPPFAAAPSNAPLCAASGEAASSAAMPFILMASGDEGARTSTSAALFCTCPPSSSSPSAPAPGMASSKWPRRPLPPSRCSAPLGARENPPDARLSRCSGDSSDGVGAPTAAVGGESGVPRGPRPAMCARCGLPLGEPRAKGGDAGLPPPSHINSPLSLCCCTGFIVVVLIMAGRGAAWGLLRKCSAALAAPVGALRLFAAPLRLLCCNTKYAPAPMTASPPMDMPA